MIRHSISLGLVLVLLHLANTHDVLSEFTRPWIAWLLQVCGLNAADQGSHLSIGRLIVPWTRDCAGLNVLAVLWAVVLWNNRHEKLTAGYWLRLGMVLPISLLANTARILTIIAFRALVYPEVESPQLHYFMGFVWIIPFLGVLAPVQGTNKFQHALEILYITTVLALVAPFVASPGGTLVGLCSLIVLAHNSQPSQQLSPNRALLAAWLVAAIFIVLSRMESLWIPWLLAYPGFFNKDHGRNWPVLLLLPGTLPVIAMQPWASVALYLIIPAVVWYRWKSPGTPHENPSASREPLRPLAMASLTACLMLPFAASIFSNLGQQPHLPPPGALARQVASNGYQIRLIGQLPDIDLTWYSPHGDGRHHTLAVCMRFRGVFLEPVADHPEIMSDGKLWMAEYFLHGGELLQHYGDYLKSSFNPLSPAGFHLIASAPCDAMSAEYFAQNSQGLAQRIFQLQTTRYQTSRNK